MRYRITGLIACAIAAGAFLLALRAATETPAIVPVFVYVCESEADIAAGCDPARNGEIKRP
jgi:hypothetical protein